MQTALACAALGAVPAIGDEVSLTPVKDNTLFESVDGSLSSGAGDFLFVGLSGAQVPPAIQHRAVLAFDLSSIPRCSIVDSASLTLTLILASPFGGQDNVKLHRVLADWGEGTSDAFGGFGAPSTADDATWIHTFFPDQFWGSAGGDFSPEISAGQTVGTTTGEYTWGSTPLMVNDVQSWLINPDANFGWIVIGNEVDPGGAKKYFSRESGVGQPVLVVEFSPAPCPWDCDGSCDGNANVADLLQLLAEYDSDSPVDCTGGLCDFDGNGCVDVVDLLKLLAHYTPDPNGIGCPM